MANLTVMDVSTGDMAQLGSVALERVGGHVIVGGGIAYAAAMQSGFGFMTVDVSDPDNPTTISINQDGPAIASTALAANGSGSGLLIGSLNGQHFADLMDISDPTNTQNRLLRYQLDSAPRDVVIASGIGFVTGESGYLTVIKYLPFDNQGQPPQVTLALLTEDIDPDTPGVQIIEGTTVVTIATVTDDVQVRNVELLVDGDVVRNDLSFPFDLASVATPGQRNVTYQVRVTDTGGNTATSDSLSIELVSDTLPPSILSAAPSDGTIQHEGVRTLRIKFSEPMDTETLSLANIQLFRVGDALNPLSVQSTQVRHGDTFLQMTFVHQLQPGDYQIVIDAAEITDRAGNTIVSLPIISQFSVRQRGGVLFPGARFDVGDRPDSVTTSDLNGDGVWDLVTANRFSNDVSVLLGRGDGTFAASADFAAGDGAASVAIADLDGDGKLDIVTANRYGRNVSVLLGHGGGAFKDPVMFAVGAGPRAVIAADLDQDGVVDLVTANFFGGSVSVLLGRGDGTFEAPINLVTSRGSQSVEVADLDGDGILDLVSTSIYSDDVSVLLGIGDGSFTVPLDLLTGDGANAVAVADLDSDGVLDVVTANRNGRNVSILLGLGDGTFAAQANFAVHFVPVSVAVGDFNRDGATDIVTANVSARDVSVLLGVGDGTFAAAVNFSTGGRPQFVAVADVDGDDVLDLVSVCPETRMRFGDG